MFLFAILVERIGESFNSKLNKDLFLKEVGMSIEMEKIADIP